MTAVLTIADADDEVVVRLESPGGLVHAYGLASSQLERFRAGNIRLTVCVDRVAASGGYMMACIADHLVAAPFAVIGSIGVVAQLPNFHRLLKKHEVDYEVLTAGEYKRTLTVFGENTEKGRENSSRSWKTPTLCSSHLFVNTVRSWIWTRLRRVKCGLVAGRWMKSSLTQSAQATTICLNCVRIATYMSCAMRLGVVYRSG